MSLLAKLIRSFAVLAVLLGFFLTPTQARAKAVAYKITDGFYISPAGLPTGVGRVVFSQSLEIEYTRGKMVLSSTPDGEGAMLIGDMIQAYATYPGNGVYTYHAKPNCVNGSSILPPTDITHLFHTGINNNINNITVRFSYWCFGPKTISPVYIVHIDDSDKPEPFLDLPWEYSSKGMSFATAATAMTSYFDHEYPFLSIGKSYEPEGTKETIVKFERSDRVNDSYSSHDGYDWGRVAQAKNGEAMLAAASGTATYVNSCGACGNAIHIDHGYGFQTRYYHMQSDGLVVAIPDTPVHVEKGQQIGKIGFSGNVSPQGEDGSHIHFMVVYDKNGDGDFNDNIPDGLVDPFGWQSKDPDPWENYTFNYLGVDRTGAKSTYLWTTPLGAKHVAIPSNGGTVDIDKYKVTFPANANNSIEFELKAFVTAITAPTTPLGVVGPGIIINAIDYLGNAITSFSSPFTLTVDFSEIDLSRYDTSTLSLYSSIDGVNWQKETTGVDLVNKKATTSVNHLTHFVLMAERLDTTSPTTTALLDGNLQTENIYTSDVTLNFDASDGAGLGVDYTAYNLDDGGWKEYTQPVILSASGKHTISYYSVDKDDNIEEKKAKSFIVQKDTTPPTTSVTLSGDLVEGTTYGSSVSLSLAASDGGGSGLDKIFYKLDGGVLQQYETPVTVSQDGAHSINYYAVDLAGNTEQASTKNFSITTNVDRIPPEVTLKFDSSTLKFVFSVQDSSGPASLKIKSTTSSKDELVATDQASNTLIIVTEKFKKSLLGLTSTSTGIKSLKYNSSSQISLDRNTFGVLYLTDKQGKLILLAQTFLSEDFGNILLNYDLKNNKTEIVETIAGKITTKNVPGMKILQIDTDSGRLKYRY